MPYFNNFTDGTGETVESMLIRLSNDSAEKDKGQLDDGLGIQKTLNRLEQWAESNKMKFYRDNLRFFI